MVTYCHGPVASSLLLSTLDCSRYYKKASLSRSARLHLLSSISDPYLLSFSLSCLSHSPCLLQLQYIIHLSGSCVPATFPESVTLPQPKRDNFRRLVDSFKPSSTNETTLSTTTATYYLLLLHAWVFGVAKSSSPSLLSCCRRSRSFYQRLDACHHASWVWCAIFIVIIIIPQQIR